MQHLRFTFALETVYNFHLLKSQAMKRLFLSISLSFISAMVVAQPVLTGPAINPVAGDAFIGYTCDTNGLSYGIAGPGITWDMSGLTSIAATPFSVVECEGTPYCEHFAISNITFTAGLDYYYNYEDSERWWQVGAYYTGLGLEYIIQKEHTVLSYPFSYGAYRIVDTAMGDSDWAPYVFFKEIDTLNADAYGTLILPTGTFANVLRVHAVIHIADSAAGSGITSYKRRESYFWYQPGFHYYLLTMSYDTAAGICYVNSISYYKQIAYAGISQQIENTKIIIAPNPTTGNISINGAGHVSIKIYNIIGKLIKEENNTDNISIAEFPSGMYFIKLFNEQGQMIKQDKIIKL